MATRFLSRFDKDSLGFVDLPALPDRNAPSALKFFSSQGKTLEFSSPHFGINHPVGHQPDSHADLDQFLARFGVTDFHKTREPDSRPVQVIVDDPESVASAAVKNETLLAGLGPIHLACFGPSVMTRHDHPQLIGKTRRELDFVDPNRLKGNGQVNLSQPKHFQATGRVLALHLETAKRMFFFELRQHGRKEKPAGLSACPQTDPADSEFLKAFQFFTHLFHFDQKRAGEAKKAVSRFRERNFLALPSKKPTSALFLKRLHRMTDR